MKLLCITDIHYHIEPFRRILRDAGLADLILLGGDLTHYGTPENVENIVQIAQSSNSRVLAVAGNCDSALIDKRLMDLGVSVAGTGVSINGVGVQGLSAAPPWLKHMYGLTEDELAQDLASGYQQVRDAAWHVVLAHVPPRGLKVDRTHLFQHVGSTALREFIEKTQPILVVCGHVHESRGVDQFGRTTVVNCGHAATGYYAVAEIDDRVRVELRRC